MASIHKSKTTLDAKRDEINDATNRMLNEGKRYANEWYEDGMKKINETQQDLQAYSDELVEKIRENPVKAVCIAGGIGYLLSMLLRK